MSKKLALLLAFVCPFVSMAQVAPRVPGSSQITGVSGNGSTLATTSGSLISGNCTSHDANGNLIDSGAACGSGGGAPSIANNTLYGNISGSTGAGTGLTPSQVQALIGGPYLQRLYFTVGTGGVIANRIVSFDASGNAIASAGTGWGGLAAATVAAGGTVEVIRSGVGTCVFDGPAVIGDAAIPSTTTAGECHDAGVTSDQSVPTTTATVGKIESTVSGAGVAGTILLHEPGSYGSLSPIGYYMGAYSGSVTYRFNDVAADGSGNNYISLAAGNLGNALTNTTYWHFLGGLSSTITGGNCVTAGQVMTGISTTGVPNCNPVTYVNGATLPASATSLATNSSGQIISGTASGSGTVNSGTAYSPAYYTATGTTVGGVTPFTGIAYYSTSVAPSAATSTQLQTAIGSNVYAPAPALVAGYQAFYAPYRQNTTTATTITDYSGNGYTGTFGTGGNAPTWLASGGGITCSANSYITIPSGVLSGLGTVQMWFALSNPQYNDVTNVGPQIMLSDSANNNIATEGAYNGQVFMAAGAGQPNYRGTDRYVNNSGLAFTFNSGTIAQYIDGRPVSGNLPATSGAGTITWNGSGNGNICNLAANASYGTSMVFYGLVVYPTVLTAAQIASNDSAFKTLIQQSAGVQFAKFQPPSTYIVSGDSRIIDYTEYGLVNSTPYLALHSFGVDNYTNLGIGGQTEATVYSNIANREYPLIDGNTTGVRVVWDEAGTNDLNSGTSAATIVTSLQNYCSALHSRYPGIKVIINTPAPRNDQTTTQETQRESLVSTLVSAWVGGTLGCDGLADEGEDMLAVNSTSPNPFVTSSAYNATYYRDGIHYQPALAKELAAQDSCSIQDVLGRMYQPCWIRKTIPYTAISEYGALTSKLATLLQLGPNWQVCGMKSQITTAFAGTSITALTATIGDSTGTTSQYITSQSLLATGSVVNMAPNFSSTHGVVQATFTATGGNLSALTAGNLNLDVCVVDIP